MRLLDPVSLALSQQNMKAINIRRQVQFHNIVQQTKAKNLQSVDVNLSTNVNRNYNLLYSYA